MDVLDYYVDAYFRKRDSSTGRAILNPYIRKTCAYPFIYLTLIFLTAPLAPFFGGDALCISEVHQSWNYRIPGLEIPVSGKDDSGHDIPTHYFITTPNMTFIPETSLDRFGVRVRADGRYTEADFTLSPQWYFEGTYYLPYIRRKPTSNLESHPYRHIWYDLHLRDFVFERGSLIPNLGRIDQSIAQEFIALRKELAAKIRQLEISTTFTGIELAELRYANEGMLFASVILTCAPQTFNLTLLTVTGFQRFFLEALACYEYLTIYRNRPLLHDDKPCDLESGLMGCFTPNLDLVEKFYRQGIPVWLVRPPAHIPSDINIDMNPLRVRPPMELDFMSDSQDIFSGHASAIRNRACQALKLGNIKLGHGAYIPHPGDFNSQYIPGKRLVHLSLSLLLTPASDSRVIRPYGPPLGASSSAAVSTSSTSTSTSATASTSAALSTSSASTPSTDASLASSWIPLPAPPIQKVINTFAINKSKFELKASVHCPASNDVWISALKSVHADPLRVWAHDDLLTLRGYAFPDPQIFINGGLHGRGLIYFLSWLSIRPAWLIESSGVEGKLHPGAQDWKDYLTLKVGTALRFFEQQPGQELTPNVKRRRTSLLSQFHLDLSSINPNVSIQWNNVVLASGGNANNLSGLSIPPRVLRQVVWDLFEHNFNFELLALDRSVHPRKLMSVQASLHRDSMVAACIPDASFIRNDMPTVQRGLGAASWLDRWEYVEALRVVMLTWPGPPSKVLASLRLTEPLDGEHHIYAARCLELERVAYPFYCQTFFEYFGRAATTPHQMPQ